MLQQSQSAIDQILTHLCEKGIYGDVVEWCEMRHDCVFVVTCPDCSDTITLNEDEYELLVRMSRDGGQSCGIRPIA
jgi:hypothetical protein